jgi:hypothetical protein
VFLPVCVAMIVVAWPMSTSAKDQFTIVALPYTQNYCTYYPGGVGNFVPEPAMLSLLGIGVSALIRRWKYH